MSFQRVPLPNSFPVMNCMLCTHGPTAQLQGQRALRLSLMFQNSTFSVEDIGDVTLENGRTSASFFSERKYGFGLIPTGGRSGNTITNPMVTDVNADNIEDAIGIMFMSYGGSGYGHHYLFAMISQRPESDRSINAALEDVNYNHFGVLIDDEVSGVLDFRVRPNHVIIVPRIYRQGDQFRSPTGRGEPLVYMLADSQPHSQPPCPSVGYFQLAQHPYLNSDIDPFVESNPDSSNVRFGSRYHHYVTEMPICSTSRPGCTVEKVFEEMTSQRRFMAPAQENENSPVEHCSVTNLRGPGWRGALASLIYSNHIINVVSSESFTAINYTLDPPGHLNSHIFHPGRVVRTVIERGGSVLVRTEGEGIGRMPRTNESEGADLFRSIDETFREYFESQAE